MSFETNKLVGKAGRVAVPAGAAAALVLAAGMFVHHNGVHAAMISSPAPMDDNSVSSLVALDNAVEAVAARVTPAVVNVAVTSRGSSEHQVGEDQEDGQEQGQGRRGRPARPPSRQCDVWSHTGMTDRSSRSMVASRWRTCRPTS